MSRTRNLNLFLGLFFCIFSLPLYAINHQSYKDPIDFNNISEIDYYTFLIRSGQLTPEELVEVYRLRGTAYSDNYELDRSLDDFNYGIALEPNYPALYGARAVVLERLGRHREALQDLQHAIELDPGNFYPYKSRGNLYFYLGRYEEAIEDFETYLRVHYADPYRMIWHYLANEVLTGQGADRLKNYAERVNLNQWPGAVIKMYLDEGSVNQVLSSLPGKMTEESRGQYCEAYFYIGQHYLLKGDVDSAKMFFVKAVRTDAKRYLEYQYAKEELKKI